MKNNKRMASLLLALVMLLSLLVLSACGSKDDGQEPQEQPQASEQEEMEVPEMEYTGYEVKTPVGTVFYPEEWVKHLKVEENTGDDTYTAAFYSKLKDEDVLLFTLQVGGDSDAYLLGSAQDEEGAEQKLWMDVNMEATEAERSEKAAERVLEMQNRVNDILDQLYHLDSFTPAQGK